MPHPNTVTLAFSASLMEFSVSLRITIPRTTLDCSTLPPRSLATRTFCTLRRGGPGPGVAAIRQASATRSESTCWYPCCLVATTCWRAWATAAWSLAWSVCRAWCGTTSSSSIPMDSSRALRYPSTISLVCRPIRYRSSASFSSSPANVITRFVPSPNSVSCCLAASSKTFAAGCCISSSLIIALQSEVTITFSKWFTTSFFRPLGPIEEDTMLAMSLAALMFLSTASSNPEYVE
mmetsp:Transcript_3787/g.5628  ORF Transcript_3787/g.5628 Transcript_3787/m.5628 type:complete len:235 (-) Transcript_3787:159-863(-)